MSTKTYRVGGVLKNKIIIIINRDMYIMLVF